MKKIPYGKIDFRKLIEEDCYYIDKTMYLSMLEDNDDTLIKESDKDNKSLYNEYYKEGIIELNKYSLDSRVNKNLKKYLVIFTGCELKLLEEIV